MGSSRPGGGRAAAAAARLRHDLGKYVRLSAPEELETDTRALRDRLRRDVLATRSGSEGERSAAEVFEEWAREERNAFPSEGRLAERLMGIASAIADIRGLASRLDSLSRAELERLDRLTRSIADDCRLLAVEARREGR
ncbi:MAG TPA: hypothetical protein VGL03_13455 [Thermoanaerobaculia bacterium]|jgi:hypothetical protein